MNKKDNDVKQSITILFSFFLLFWQWQFRKMNSFHNPFAILGVLFLVDLLVEKFKQKPTMQFVTRWSLWLALFSIVTHTKSWHTAGKASETWDCFCFVLASLCVLKPVSRVRYTVTVLEEGESCSSISCQALQRAWSDQSAPSFTICFM